MKPKILLFDKSFAHAHSVGNGDLPVHCAQFDWCRNETESNLQDFCVITDDYLADAKNIGGDKDKIGYIIEPKSVQPKLYDFVANPDNLKPFKFIFTHRVDLAAQNTDKFRLLPLAGTWIHPTDWQLYGKSPNTISFIASNKAFAPGHKLRQQVVEALYTYPVDVFGRGRAKEITSKLQGLKDYQYSIVIENEQTEGWFTEKLIDCFLTGTIPIYWGCPAIDKHFMKEGMILVNSKEEIVKAVKQIADGSITPILPSAIRFNHYIAKNFWNTEQIMFEKYFSKMIK